MKMSGIVRCFFLALTFAVPVLSSRTHEDQMDILNVFCSDDPEVSKGRNTCAENATEQVFQIERGCLKFMTSGKDKAAFCQVAFKPENVEVPEATQGKPDDTSCWMYNCLTEEIAARRNNANAIFDEFEKMYDCFVDVAKNSGKIKS